MAAGLGFKTFTTGEVLTAADVNGYLMQGILVFANATARTSAITSPQEGQYSFLKDTNALEYYDGAAWVGAPVGDITAVNAGTGITGGGASGSVTITNDMATTITAAGDIVVGTGNATYDNLPIGTTGQVLTADTTVSPYKIKWATAAGGSSMTSLATGTLSGSAFSASITGISTAYTHLQLWITDLYGTGANIIQLRFNSNSGAVYSQQLAISTQSPNIVGSSGNDRISTYNGIITSSNQNGYLLLNLPFYSTTVSAKPFMLFWNRTGGSNANEQMWGSFDSTSAITSISFSLDGGTSYSGGDYTLYGVK